MLMTCKCRALQQLLGCSTLKISQSIEIAVHLVMLGWTSLWCGFFWFFFVYFTKRLDSKRAIWALNLAVGSHCPGAHSGAPGRAEVQKGSRCSAGEKTHVRFLAVLFP